MILPVVFQLCPSFGTDPDPDPESGSVLLCHTEGPNLLSFSDTLSGSTKMDSGVETDGNSKDPVTCRPLIQDSGPTLTLLASLDL